MVPSGFAKGLILRVLVSRKESLERSCRLSGYDQMDQRINGSYAHAFSFGGHRVRKISTGICVSKERFGEASFLR